MQSGFRFNHCVCMCAKLGQLSLTLLNPIDYSLLGSSAHGFSRQEYWSGLLCPPPGDFPDTGIERRSLTSPALADVLYR